jgi:antitoxin component of MazEF toxin-antitoxin module
MLKMTTSSQSLEDSQVLFLPKEILQAALFAEGEMVEILADKTGIKIQKSQSAETLNDLFKNYNGTYHCEEIDTGTPVGRETF